MELILIGLALVILALADRPRTHSRRPNNADGNARS
jgi:hypothetical protein